MTAAPAPLNLACNKVAAAASSHFRNLSEYTAMRGLDGDPTTRWSSGEPYNGQTEWLAVDLGRVSLWIGLGLCGGGLCIEVCSAGHERYGWPRCPRC